MRPSSALRTGRAAGAALLPLLGALGSGALAQGCAPALDGDDAALIDDYIASIEREPLPETGKTYGPPSDPERDGEYSCTTQNVSETRQYDRIVAYAANSEVLWPGAIIAGASLDTGDLVPLPFAREPVSFSVSLGNLVGERATTLDDPKLSTYREALGDILSAELSGATAANIYSEIEEIYSAEQLALAVGVNVSALAGFGGSASVGFDFARDDVRSRYLVKYTQAYYTVDVDPPTVPSDFLAGSVTLEDVEDRVAPDEPPLYVSSITYGRTVLFTFESSHSARELGAALDFTYRAGVDVSGELEAQHESVLDTTSIHAYILGGSGAEAARAIDSYEGLIDFIKQGGDYSPASPGAPIAYKLAFLDDNQPARIALTEEYTERECSRVSQQVRVVLTGIEVESANDGNDDLELYGQIWAADDVMLFDRAQGQHIEVLEGDVFPASGYVAETILDVSPEPGAVIELGAALREHDANVFNGDDDLGEETVEVPFETGWDREVTLYLSGDGSLVNLHFSLEPL